MIDSIRRKPVSKPKPYTDIRGKYKWVVYFYDPQKDVRAKKLFVDKFSADEFYEEKSLVENRLGVEANSISFEDKRDLLEVKRLLEPLNISFLDAIKEFAQSTTELAKYGVRLSKVVETYKEWYKAKKISVPLRRAMEVYVETKKRDNLSKRHLEKIENLLDRFCEDLGNRKTVALITHHDIDAWLNGVRKRVYADSPTETLNGRPMKVFTDTDEPISIVSRNRFRSMLYSFFKFCKMKDWIAENPVEKVVSLRQKPKTPEIFKVAEVANMLNCSEEKSDIRAYIAIGAFAGLRRRELERLTWDKIKLEDREIVLDSEMTKTASRRVVKITENLAKWLEPYTDKLNTNEHLVCPNFVKRFSDFRDKNDIKWVDNGLRHSAATYYLALTKNAYLTAEQMGHAVDVLKQHYNGLAREKEAIAYFNIEPKQQ